MQLSGPVATTTSAHMATGGWLTFRVTGTWYSGFAGSLLVRSIVASWMPSAYSEVSSVTVTSWHSPAGIVPLVGSSSNHSGTVENSTARLSWM